MSRRASYARAFLRQARSDFETYLRIRVDPRIPRCHKPQFLQMACEKTAKAYLASNANVDPDHLPGHDYVGTTFRAIGQRYLDRDDRFESWAIENRRRLASRLNQLAREVDELSPSGKPREGGVRPDNCEYPWAWERDADYLAPADHGFPNIGDFFTAESERRTGAEAEFLRLIRFAIDLLTEGSPSR